MKTYVLQRRESYGEDGPFYQARGGRFVLCSTGLARWWDIPPKAQKIWVTIWGPEEVTERMVAERAYRVVCTSPPLYALLIQDSAGRYHNSNLGLTEQCELYANMPASRDQQHYREAFVTLHYSLAA